MVDTLRQRLRTALTAAMKARDQVRVSALRSGISAIDNAESVVVDPVPASPSRSGVIAGALSGLGAAEVPRLVLSTDQMSDVVRREVADRLSAADEMERLGAGDRAERLRAEATVLATFIEPN